MHAVVLPQPLHERERDFHIYIQCPPYRSDGCASQICLQVMMICLLTLSMAHKKIGYDSIVPVGDVLSCSVQCRLLNPHTSMTWCANA